MTQKPSDETRLIRYTLSESYLGRLLLAATTRGVCAVGFADTDRVLVEHLQAEFPDVMLSRDDRGLAHSLPNFSRLSRVLNPIPISPSTFAAHHFSFASGRRCEGFRAARRGAIRKSRT